MKQQRDPTMGPSYVAVGLWLAAVALHDVVEKVRLLGNLQD